MIAAFTHEEGSILIRLLIAHCLTDFFWQPNHWIKGKKEHIWKSKYLFYHILLTGLVAWIAVWDLSYWPAIAILMISHWLIDGLKLKISQRSIRSSWEDLMLFLADQFLHVVVIVMIWLFVIKGWPRIQILGGMLRSDYRILLRILGYLVVAGPAGFIIQFLTRRWSAELNLEDSLPEAGRWIGTLERILTITLVYTNQFAAIGFLITAKSILRIIDKPDKPVSEPGLVKPFSARKHTEYVLIGTFFSFTIALITGLIINGLL